MFRFGSVRHQQSKFIINKGSVRVVKSDEDFKVKYGQELNGHIDIRTTGESIAVNVDRNIDNAQIEVNVAGLRDCDVKLQAGILTADATCDHSKFTVVSGTIDATLNRAELGKVSASVSTGCLTNTSGLSHDPAASGGAAAAASGSAAWGAMMGQWFSQMGAMSLGYSVHLVGDLGADHVAVFELGSGVINLHH